MELQFIYQNAGDTPKRRRLAKACDTCRARKKRCVHFNGAADDQEPAQRDSARPTDPSEDDVDDAPNSNVSAATIAALEKASNGAAVAGANGDAERTDTAGSKRFFSDITPETLFLGGTGANGESQRKPDDIGVWVDRREWEALVRQKNSAPEKEGTAEEVSVLSLGVSGQRPHSTILGPLIDIYFSKVQPILPLLDEDEFRKQQTEGKIPEPLIHAVCLVAAKQPEAEPHLKLGLSPSTIPPRQYCSRLYTSVQSAVRTGVQYDKLILIRMLALVSLHNEGSEGAEEASMYLSQAMHHAQTLGIHLGQHSSTPTGPDLSLKRLFWSLWTLDRMSSAINGRPIIMADIDIAIEPFAQGESGYPAFEAWLKVTEMLNRVIGLYRPHKDVEVKSWEDDFFGLEELLDDSGAWQQPRSVIGTIHLFYLSVAMLSHGSRGMKQVPRATNSSIRQRLCAIEVVRLLESDHCQDLHALPFIPYAVSLALSVSYQHLRQSQLQHQQEDARNDFRRCTKLLQNLRRTWSSADTMAALATKVLSELDRAPSLASFRIKRVPKGSIDTAERPPPCPPAMNGERTGLFEVITGTDEAAHPNGNTTEPQDDDEILNATTNGAAAVVDAGLDLFEGMDDIFGTYLDPKYPMTLDDTSFLDDMPPFDWNDMRQHDAWAPK